MAGRDGEAEDEVSAVMAFADMISEVPNQPTNQSIVRSRKLHCHPINRTRTEQARRYFQSLSREKTLSTLILGKYDTQFPALYTTPRQSYRANLLTPAPSRNPQTLRLYPLNHSSTPPPPAPPPAPQPSHPSDPESHNSLDDEHMPVSNAV